MYVVVFYLILSRLRKADPVVLKVRNLYVYINIYIYIYTERAYSSGYGLTWLLPVIFLVLIPLSCLIRSRLRKADPVVLKVRPPSFRSYIYSYIFRLVHRLMHCVCTYLSFLLAATPNTFGGPGSP